MKSEQVTVVNWTLEHAETIVICTHIKLLNLSYLVSQQVSSTPQRHLTILRGFIQQYQNLKEPNGTTANTRDPTMLRKCIQPNKFALSPSSRYMCASAIPQKTTVDERQN